MNSHLNYLNFQSKTLKQRSAKVDSSSCSCSPQNTTRATCQANSIKEMSGILSEESLNPQTIRPRGSFLPPIPHQPVSVFSAKTRFSPIIYWCQRGSGPFAPFHTCNCRTKSTQAKQTDLQVSVIGVHSHSCDVHSTGTCP